MSASLNIPVPEGNLHISVYGETNAIPIVLLHGTAAYHYCWRNVAAALAAKYRVYCPDLLGAGFSDKPKDALYSKHAQSLRIISLVKSLDCGPIHLVGHSMGGEIAAHVALASPELIRSLTLIAPDGFRKGVSPLLQWAARKGWMNRIFRQAMRSQMKPKVLARIIGIPAQQITPEFMANWTKPYGHPNLPYIIERTLADDDTGVISNRINHLMTRTQLIYGTNDKMIPKRVFEQYRQSLPNLCTEVYENCGHVLMEQCPSRLADSIDRFIAVDKS
ncbi:alpha/beta fold hydrolase [Paenibacillus sp. GCM10027626]|uniref:alpha/beta fold hydrolase n=1 Tax=Paenibacillus sp. GCM10027626 TaxID=3273411 RepID=UPI00362649B1